MTDQDTRDLRAEMCKGFDDIRTDIRDLANELKESIAELRREHVSRTELDGCMNALRFELKGDFAVSRQDRQSMHDRLTSLEDDSSAASDTLARYKGALWVVSIGVPVVTAVVTEIIVRSLLH